MQNFVPFFSDQNTKASIRSFIQRLSYINFNEKFEVDRNEKLTFLLGSMLDASEEWDRNCQISIETIGRQFHDVYISSGDDLPKQRLDLLFALCFRFLYELNLSIPGELARDLKSAQDFAYENLDKFEVLAKEQIEWVTKNLPVSMMKSLFSSDSMANVRDCNNFASDFSSKLKAWRDELNKDLKTVSLLKESLSEYKNGFNFVGLFQGFDELSSAKKNELNGLLGWMALFGFLMVLPVLMELGFLYIHRSEVDEVKIFLLLALVPVISLVLLFGYFFRIVLQNHRSVKSQLLQIELRKTLCRFIQHYVEYSAEARKQSGESLAKFENIVFSGIVADDERLPSTFDGLEQFSALIKSVRT